MVRLEMFGTEHLKMFTLGGHECCSLLMEQGFEAVIRLIESGASNCIERRNCQLANRT